MFRMLAIAAMFALAAPVFALAQGHEHEEEHHPGPHPAAPPRPVPHPAGPLHPAPPPHPVPHPGPPPGPMAVPHPGGPPVAQFSYRGHMVNRVHLDPFVYPSGWAYRRWAVGAVLPPVFLVPAYYYANWAPLGLPPPPMGDQWVRYGPDLLLVDTGTGRVIEVVYGVFY